MRAVAAIAWVILALVYPAVVYFSSTLWSARTASLVLLCTLGSIYGLQRLAGSPAKAGPMGKVPLFAVATLGLGALLGNGGFAQLVPVVVNTGLLILFASSLRGPITMVESFARRQDPELSPEKVQYCRAVTIVWCGFFVFNIVVTITLALAAAISWWTLYTGLIAYVAMGALFTGEYVVRKARFRDYASPPHLHERLFARLFPPRVETEASSHSDGMA